jgi:indole-3-glycerol phosphate synthase
MAGRRQNILERIADTTRRRVAATLAERPLEDLRQEALTLAERDEGAFRFEGALREAGMSFICE